MKSLDDMTQEELEEHFTSRYGSIDFRALNAFKKAQSGERSYDSDEIDELCQRNGSYDGKLANYLNRK
jgi:hypothetical protein